MYGPEYQVVRSATPVYPKVPHACSCCTGSIPRTSSIRMHMRKGKSASKMRGVQVAGVTVLRTCCVAVCRLADRPTSL